jgi:methylphosphotriester-DNA--protein-cysteine methyltransferase
MKPSLAFGPIDSITQYLLYLSVVVLGVLLPMLAAKWRTRRENKRLLQRTVLALNEELSGNRRRMQTSLGSFAALTELLQQKLEHYLAQRVLQQAGGVPTAAHKVEFDMNIGLTVSTAWDVARMANALVLLPSPALTALTRAYQMQAVFDSDRHLLVNLGMQTDLLELPADLQDIRVLDGRLQALTQALAVLQYHTGLLGGLIACYDQALVTNRAADGAANSAATGSAAA